MSVTISASTLALAILDTSARIPDPEVAHRCRDLTTSWSIRDYHGPLYADDDLTRLMSRAADNNHTYLLVQAVGHVIRRAPGPKEAGIGNFFIQAMRQADGAGAGLIALGTPVEGMPQTLRDHCMLIDLERWRKNGRTPPRWSRDEAIVSFADCGEDVSVTEFGADAQTWSAYLNPEDASYGHALQRLTREGLEIFTELKRDHALNGSATLFLGDLARIVTLSPDGFFPWNFEGYQDLDRVSAPSTGPVDSLYCVAAGFKPNAILQRIGFTPTTRVVLVDYSQNALDIRRWLVENWNGRDFPAILARMLERFPPSGTFYYLPGYLDPETGYLNHSKIQALWEHELEDWGGADVFERHWQAYRVLPHVYLRANLLAESGKLVELLRDEANPVIWWSNVFTSAFAFWHYDAEARFEIYRSWLKAISEHSPEAYLFGYDHLNRQLSGARARGLPLPQQALPYA